MLIKFQMQIKENPTARILPGPHARQEFMVCPISWVLYSRVSTDSSVFAENLTIYKVLFLHGMFNLTLAIVLCDREKGV